MRFLRRVAGFQLKYPDSVEACDALDEVIEEAIPIFAQSDPARAYREVEMAKPVNESCDKLEAETRDDPMPGADFDVTGRQLTRRMSLLTIAEAAEERGDTRLQRLAFEHLASEASFATNPRAHIFTVNTHRTATSQAGRLALMAKDYPAAREWFRREANVARGHKQRLPLLEGLRGIAMVEAQLDNAEGLADAGAEVAELRARAIRDKWKLGEPRTTGRPLQELENSLADLLCLMRPGPEIKATVGRLESRVAALESQVTAGQGGRSIKVRLADDHFYLGSTYEEDYRFDDARKSYDRSLEVRRTLETTGNPLEMTPFVMARRARLDGGAALWGSLKRWLQDRTRERELTEDEEILLKIATAETAGP